MKIILISTSFQLISCVEYFKGEIPLEFELIIFSNKKNTLNQLRSLLKFYKIKPNKIILLKHRISPYIFFLKYFLIKTPLIICGYIFYKPIEILLFLKPFSQLIVLDDGLFSLKINEKINSNILRKMRFSNKKVTYYTMIENKEIGTSVLVKNNFNWHHSKFSSKKTKDEILFIGSPLVEKGILSKNDYLEFIIKTFKLNKNRIIYHPHRLENLDKFSNITDKNFLINNNNFSFDEIILRGNFHPKRIIGFSSTALVFSNFICRNSQINFIKINSNLYNETYKYFKKIGLNEIYS